MKSTYNNSEFPYEKLLL